jgi:thioredoxin reductase (NADPH)
MHALIQNDAEISAALMSAFIHRRVAVIAQGIGDVLLIGSVGSGATLRIKQFLTRNGHPFKYLDLDREEWPEFEEIAFVEPRDLNALGEVGRARRLLV